MFRIGGSAGEGITSGLKPRQRYEEGDAVGGDLSQSDFETQDTGSSGINLDREMLKRIASTNIKLPKSTSGADFWLNYGTSILAQPGGRPILQTLGTAGKEPLLRYQQQRGAEDALKYKHEVGNRQFLLDAWKTLSDEDKTAMQKNIAWLQTEEGGNLTQAEALDRVAGKFRKDMSPTEKKYKEKQTEEELDRKEIADIQSYFADDYILSPSEAAKYRDFRNVVDGVEGIDFRRDDSVFIDRGSWPAGSFTEAVGKDGNITLHKNNVGDFEEGFAYLDLKTGEAYYRDGVKLIKIVVDEDIITNN
tara:strand:+ start:61 stop:975 length:915 start_codon:yes stop_codon:yes gene_type:complete